MYLVNNAASRRMIVALQDFYFSGWFYCQKQINESLLAYGYLPHPDEWIKPDDAPPNTHPAPTLFIDEVMQYSTPTEVKILLAMSRHILAWEFDIAPKVLSTVMLMKITGASRTTVIDSLKVLVSAELITKAGTGDPSRDIRLLNCSRELINWDWLKNRRVLTDERNRAKMERALRRNREGGEA
jgi:hypothetical protein